MCIFTKTLHFREIVFTPMTALIACINAVFLNSMGTSENKVFHKK